MYQTIAEQAFYRLLATTLLFLAGAGSACADSLSINEAEQLALKDDYTLRAINARSLSMAELSVATEKLPDPKLKLGFANLPTDSFNLGREPMTQTIVGVQQRFPRGQTRALSSNRLLESAARSNAQAQDRMQKIKLEVRQEYARIYLHQERQRILKRSKIVFADLTEITRDYYATGRAQQQDVVQSQLEMSKVEERLSRIQQQEEEARARLAEKVGAAAYLELDPLWPVIAEPLAASRIIENLNDHPRLRAWQHEIAKSRTSEEIARQAYKPGFAVDLAYGGRGGQNTDGSDRTDFLSVFVTMDVPLFTKNRQDRVLASSIAETSATQFARDDIYRSMKAGIAEGSASLARQRERLALYRDNLLPQASFNAEASFEAYQDAVDDLTTLMRARIGEYELKLDHASLRADEIITRARLLYLQGESS
uniref:Outer membrane efflux protein n=1 Tax=uncultured bacterium pES01019D12 TaxID=355333 RepID=A0EJK0_9BACT|nr:outer membrane efflux protein [uncultured bacterium pES01019D12]